jgi:hypothetical protein
MIRRLILTLAIGLLPIAASAQPADDPAPDAAAAAQTSQGPRVVERIHSGFLVAPDFKATEFNHRTDGLAGGYAGVVFADAVFIGGGGYGLVTSTHGQNLAYGGLVMQWFGRGSDTFGYSAKMLVGGGTAASVCKSAAAASLVPGYHEGHNSVALMIYRQFFTVLPSAITLSRGTALPHTR